VEQARGEGVGIAPVETAVVRAIVEGMPDPLCCSTGPDGCLHFKFRAGQLAPALRKNELAQFALRSPEIITALREAIASAEPEADHLSRPRSGRPLDGVDCYRRSPCRPPSAVRITLC